MLPRDAPRLGLRCLPGRVFREEHVRSVLRRIRSADGAVAAGGSGGGLGVPGRRAQALASAGPASGLVATFCKYFPHELANEVVIRSLNSGA